MLHNIVVIDLKTTGTNLFRDRIIEFGAWIINNGKTEKSISFLIQPDCPVPEKILRLTGINKLDLDNALCFEKCREQILEAIGSRTIVAHNAPFDINFLENALSIKLNNKIWDTLELGRIFFPTASQHGLQALTRYLEIELDTDFRFHEALNDAWAAWKVLKKCYQKAIDFDLSFYIEGNKLLHETYSRSFFEEIEKKIHREFPARTIKTGFVMAELHDLNGIFHMEDNNEKDFPYKQEWVNKCFSANGLLEKNLSSYERRDGQQRMAAEVTQALSNSKHVIIEAGTGIGKSYAYLIPSLWWSKFSGHRVVIATHTIPLQEQLEKKDLPLLNDIIPFKFKVAVLKGRTNYLCIKNWLLYIKTAPTQSTEERLAALSILVWLRETLTGDLQELRQDAFIRTLWANINSSLDCLPHRCSHADKCFLLRARERAIYADIIIVNHSLLLTDFKTDFNILPEYHYLVIDEAHHLYQSALNHLGWGLTYEQLQNLLDRIVHPSKGSFYSTFKNQIFKFKNEFPGVSWELFQRELDSLPNSIKAVAYQANELFNILLVQLTDGNALRLKREDIGKPWWPIFEVSIENTIFRLQEILSLCKRLASILEGETEDELEFIRFELQTYRREIEEICKGLKSALEIDNLNSVIWIEKFRNQSALRVTPVEVNKVLKEKFIDKLRSAIFTSATLSVAGEFSHFMDEVGLDLDTTSICIQSPFDYENQLKFFVVKDLTSYTQENYISELANFITEVASHMNGRTLILFTSHKSLQEVNLILRDNLRFSGIDIYAQGVDGNRRLILEEFIDNPRAILLGANSFWEGIDIPGGKLSCVILVKIPFSPPTLPVVEARSEVLKQKGKNPFQELLLPEAIIRFKQGFGRLIRRKTDTGIVLLLDSRSLQKSYGKLLFESLPIETHFRGDRSYVLRKIEEWSQENKNVIFPNASKNDTL